MENLYEQRSIPLLSKNPAEDQMQGLYVHMEHGNRHLSSCRRKPARTRIKNEFPGSLSLLLEITANGRTKI